MKNRPVFKLKPVTLAMLSMPLSVKVQESKKRKPRKTNQS